METAIESKECKTCKETKDITCFRKQRRECKECVNKKYRNESISLLNIERLICTGCNTEKDINNFRPRHKVCKACVNDNMRVYFKDHYEKNKVKYKNKEKERNKVILENLDENTMKECRDCKLSKSVFEFRLNRGQCKECERISNKNYTKNKRDNDPLYKLISVCRIRLIQALGLENKKDKTIEYLGEDIQLIKNWLEYNFDDKMTWNNHGEYWHIDHVIPVSKFNLKDEDDVYKCFNWKNLSPLTKEKNLSKSNNIIPVQVLNHIEKLKQFSNNEKTIEYIQIFHNYI